jgi:hypothetical protein
MAEVREPVAGVTPAVQGAEESQAGSEGTPAAESSISIFTAIQSSLA